MVRNSLDVFRINPLLCLSLLVFILIFVFVAVVHLHIWIHRCASQSCNVQVFQSWFSADILAWLRDMDFTWNLISSGLRLQSSLRSQTLLVINAELHECLSAGILFASTFFWWLCFRVIVYVHSSPTSGTGTARLQHSHVHPWSKTARCIRLHCMLWWHAHDSRS